MVVPPDSWARILPLGAFLLAAVLFMGLLVTRGARNRPVAASAPLGLQLRVRVLLGRGDKAQAIQEVRESTGLGLDEAEDLIETLRGGLPEPFSTGTGSLARRTRTLREAGDDVGAVVLVCMETGMNPNEARKFVQAID